MNEHKDILQRLDKAKEYMDEPYNKGLEGEDLKKAIEEREKYIPYVLELMKEAKKEELSWMKR